MLCFAHPLPTPLKRAIDQGRGNMVFVCWDPETVSCCPACLSPELCASPGARVLHPEARRSRAPGNGHLRVRLSPGPSSPKWLRVQEPALSWARMHARELAMPRNGLFGDVARSPCTCAVGFVCLIYNPSCCLCRSYCTSYRVGWPCIAAVAWLHPQLKWSRAGRCQDRDEDGGERGGAEEVLECAPRPACVVCREALHWLLQLFSACSI